MTTENNLRRALQFYADPSDYRAPFTGGLGKLYFDCGEVARSALTEADEPQSHQNTGWQHLTDEDREAAFKSMPDMLEGFLKTWGWLHFAKEIERRCKEKNAR